MSIIFALKTAVREFLRNRDDIDKIQPPYGSQFNSRVSQKTSQVIANIMSDIDYAFFQVIKDFDSKRRNLYPDAFQPDWIDLFFIFSWFDKNIISTKDFRDGEWCQYICNNFYSNKIFKSHKICFSR